MSESPGNKKTRRRFLADMLFLGGGLTAAGLLARAHLPTQMPSPPALVGDVVQPQPGPIKDPTLVIETTPACTKTPDPSPEIAGNMAMPPPQQTPTLYDKVSPNAPAMPGQRIAPHPKQKRE